MARAPALSGYVTPLDAENENLRARAWPKTAAVLSGNSTGLPISAQWAVYVAFVIAATNFGHDQWPIRACSRGLVCLLASVLQAASPRAEHGSRAPGTVSPQTA